MPYHAMPCHAMPCHAMPCHAMPCHAMPYHTIPYHTIPYHTIPYHTIPYHTIPYHTIPYHTIPYMTLRSIALHTYIPYIGGATDSRSLGPHFRTYGSLDDAVRFGHPQHFRVLHGSCQQYMVLGTHGTAGFEAAAQPFQDAGARGNPKLLTSNHSRARRASRAARSNGRLGKLRGPSGSLPQTARSRGLPPAPLGACRTQ